MAHINDARYDALVAAGYDPKHIDDILYTVWAGNKHTSDDEYAFYISNDIAPSTISDMRYAFLLAQGIPPGHVNDMWLAFWLSGTIPPPGLTWVWHLYLKSANILVPFDLKLAQSWDMEFTFVVEGPPKDMHLFATANEAGSNNSYFKTAVSGQLSIKLFGGVETNLDFPLTDRDFWQVAKLSYDGAGNATMTINDETHPVPAAAIGAVEPTGQLVFGGDNSDAEMRIKNLTVTQESIIVHECACDDGPTDEDTPTTINPVAQFLVSTVGADLVFNNYAGDRQGFWTKRTQVLYEMDWRYGQPNTSWENYAQRRNSDTSVINPNGIANVLPNLDGYDLNVVPLAGSDFEINPGWRMEKGKGQLSNGVINVVPGPNIYAGTNILTNGWVLNTANNFTNRGYADPKGTNGGAVPWLAGILTYTPYINTLSGMKDGVAGFSIVLLNQRNTAVPNALNPYGLIRVKGKGGAVGSIWVNQDTWEIGTIDGPINVWGQRMPNWVSPDNTATLIFEAAILYFQFDIGVGAGTIDIEWGATDTDGALTRVSDGNNTKVGFALFNAFSDDSTTNPATQTVGFPCRTIDYGYVRSNDNCEITDRYDEITYPSPNPYPNFSESQRFTFLFDWTPLVDAADQVDPSVAGEASNVGLINSNFAGIFVLINSEVNFPVGSRLSYGLQLNGSYDVSGIVKYLSLDTLISPAKAGTRDSMVITSIGTRMYVFRNGAYVGTLATTAYWNVGRHAALGAYTAGFGQTPHGVMHRTMLRRDPMTYQECIDLSAF